MVKVDNEQKKMVGFKQCGMPSLAVTKTNI